MFDLVTHSSSRNDLMNIYGIGLMVEVHQVLRVPNPINWLACGGLQFISSRPYYCRDDVGAFPALSYFYPVEWAVGLSFPKDKVYDLEIPWSDPGITVGLHFLVILHDPSSGHLSLLFQTVQVYNHNIIIPISIKSSFLGGRDPRLNR